MNTDETHDTPVPTPDADLRAIGRYAASLRVAGGPAARATLDAGLRDFRERGALPRSPDEMRVCLAVLWALLPYVAPAGPSPEQERFLRALVAGLRGDPSPGGQPPRSGHPKP